MYFKNIYVYKFVTYFKNLFFRGRINKMDRKCEDNSWALKFFRKIRTDCGL